MGMSTHVTGFKQPNDKFHQMFEVWEACKKAKVPVPLIVEKFFNGEPPDPAGVTIDEDALVKSGAIKCWSDDGADGFELHIDKLDSDIKIVRFFNAW
jgi:hypothetical protein